MIMNSKIKYPMLFQKPTLIEKIKLLFVPTKYIYGEPFDISDKEQMQYVITFKTMNGSTYLISESVRKC